VASTRPRDERNCAQLKDGGVQVIGVTDRWFPSIRCRYEVQRESAIMSILRDWHANDAITSVVVVRGIEISAAKEELLKTLLEEEGIAYEFKSAGDQRLADFLSSLSGASSCRRQLGGAQKWRMRSHRVCVHTGLCTATPSRRCLRTTGGAA
jgi:hypothetical protein